MGINIEEFDYSLPKEFIAQYPEKEREASRMLVFNRADGSMTHRAFRDVTQYLKESDVLVLNDSKVIPARISAKKPTGARVDILLIEKINDKSWFCLVNGVKGGVRELKVLIGHREATLRRGIESWIIEFDQNREMFDIMGEYGKMPLPPYVKRKDGDGAIDIDRYQTVYAEMPGSIAAPTAGFHFTEQLLNVIRQTGVNVLKITLHIGIGTFFLIKTQNVADHRMHGEYYHVTPEAKAFIRKAKDEGRRIIACGTSVVRTLESLYERNGSAPLAGKTELFIYPGHHFNVVDALITNFHLPRSTPLLLVSAFAGTREIMRCYTEAIEKGYRFYSYGDAMFIL
ncbi:MAG: tRNA preQ1(34) S-adenosylmethionine ribosyltransferase-isomerase QueA [Syntrophorhabdus sp.]|jgi:S-adenosylmethionine:tRNA ribosyltransferase-isomerase|nr:tRNA preQ1(34) S-adenosylmethionine ribosyltransferase-isomerase QueA [Syntrophorhabdus sp.]MDI9557327.1 tRNA preQ1(34) S-adenosylmethionine ribosyltransferase-isomerase QueA [Pseudomonadota bacterium]OPX97983.1 MAG: S-adenosylmethionine:tRNA ribosyltransferase-isomerase [Syntrophorhabdus sp. PtaB.Bin027]MBP8745056.1 tRNA preQ1(34) S-adenosylmethionine ribosyltransferase-isomerase QueA [Syntrophorhabdus sp.]HQG26546.1 tRNA preQ1(34) S-adenosylmethionine ribosyltransferase-isomerase QueA [Syn